MNPEEDRTAETSEQRSKTGFSGWGSYLFGLKPERRMYASWHWDIAMLICGLGMLLGSAMVLSDGGKPFLGWLSPIGGFAVVLLALSDLLVDRGARRVVSALRAVAQLIFCGIILGWIWTSINGSEVAIVALAFGSAAAVLGVLLGRAREAEERDTTDGS